MTQNNSGLSDNQQAILVFIAFALPSLSAWAAIGFPTSRLALGGLVAALIAGVILAIKEAWGISVPAQTTVTPTPTPIKTNFVTVNPAWAQQRAYFTTQPWQF